MYHKQCPLDIIQDKIGVVPIENRNIQIDEDGTIKMDNYNMFKYDTPEENSDTSVLYLPFITLYHIFLNLSTLFSKIF